MKQNQSAERQLSYTDLKRSRLQLLFIALLVFLLFWGVVELLQAVFKHGNWRLLPALIGFVALEGAWTTRWLMQASRRVKRHVYRLSEIIILLLLTTFTFWLGLDDHLRSAFLELFFASPLSILNSSLIFWMIACLSAWTWSIRLTDIFNQLVISKEEVSFFTASAAERQEKGFALVAPVYRRQLANAFIRNWVTGGVLLAALAMLATIELSSSNLATIQSLQFRNVSRLGLSSGHLLALVAYFAAGFWLVSHARMAVMQARWIAGGLDIESRILERWRRQAILIIGVIAVVAAFLPIGSTLAIANIIKAMLSFLITIISLIFAIIPLILAWILSLLPGTELQLTEEVPVEPLESLLPPLEGSQARFEIPPNLLSAIFFATAMAVSILAFLYFFRFRNFTFKWSSLSISWQNIGSRIRAAWSALTGTTSEWLESVKNLAAHTIKPERLPRFPTFVMPSLVKLPEQKVRMYYLWTIKHAQSEGVSRPDNGTPLEYERLIQEHWPDTAADFQDLTRLFIQARYSNEHLEESQAQLAESIFRNLRKSIRRRFDVK